MGTSLAPHGHEKASLQLGIARWSVWPDGLADEDLWRTWLNDGENAPVRRDTDLTYVDAMARRRLGRLSRIALHVTGKASAGLACVPMIFASRHGELTRTLGILQGLARDEPPSPAAFSLSVHNTSLGIASIARKDPSPGTALAAGEETLLWALLDAALRLGENPSQPVLLVYADEPLPEPYAADVDSMEPAHAIALLLEEGSDLSLEWAENPHPTASARPLSLSLLACLLGQETGLEWRGQRLLVQGQCHA